LRVWNTWNNFDRSGLRQFKTDADSFRDFRSKFRFFCHLDVFVGHGLSDYFTVARLGVARPILHEGGWHVTRFKMGDTETAEAVEALFLDSEFFKNRVQRATKEVRLEEGRPCARRDTPIAYRKLAIRLIREVRCKLRCKLLCATNDLWPAVFKRTGMFGDLIFRLPSPFDFIPPEIQVTLLVP
jgi:hypothetical protein